MSVFGARLWVIHVKLNACLLVIEHLFNFVLNILIELSRVKHGASNKK